MRADVHFSYVSSLERGVRNVGLEVIVRVAEALDIDPGVLIAGIKTRPGASVTAGRRDAGSA